MWVARERYRKSDENNDNNEHIESDGTFVRFTRIVVIPATNVMECEGSMTIPIHDNNEHIASDVDYYQNNCIYRRCCVNRRQGDAKHVKTFTVTKRTRRITTAAKMSRLQLEVINIRLIRTSPGA